MQTPIKHNYRRTGCLRLPRTSRIAIVLLTVMALISGCENSTDSKQSASTEFAAPVSSTAIPRQTVSISTRMAEKSGAANTQSTTAGSKATTSNLDTEAAQLRASRLLHDADRSASTFKVIGPHTKNVVTLYQFFEAAGWNAFLDGLTMKSCPDGYDFFCQTRGVFVEFYGKAGGDVNSLVELARNMDIREHFYNLASAADMYQARHQTISGQTSTK